MNQSQKTLELITKEFKEKTGLSPVISSEIEFYIDPKAKEFSENFDEDFKKELIASKIPFLNFSRESGKNQFEVSLMHFEKPELAAALAITLIKTIKKQAEKFAVEAVFDPKPYENQPGSGLQINISLNDKDGKNVFQKTGEEETDFMKWAAAGLLETMAESMIFFAPNKNSYKRFVGGFNKETETYNNAPTRICWGSNNRTTALRIPASTKFEHNRHIEHRIPGPDADPYQIISAILIGIMHGIENKLTPPEKIYGNAYDKKYSYLPELPTSLEEAKIAFENGKIIKLLLQKF